MKSVFRILAVLGFVSTAVPMVVHAEDAPAPAIKFSGFVDAYYSYNFNKPKSMLNNEPTTNFDFYHNTFSLNLAELVVSKDAAPVGFRMDLDFGPTTDFVHGGPAFVHPGAHPISTEVDTFKNIQQAYVTWATPLKVTLDFGKFVTHMGAEVIESKDNWNYTRSLLFCCAIPYYHSGVRANYPVNDKLYVNGYVYNGWNDVIENNHMKTFGAQIGITPIKPLQIVLNWIGPEECTDPATCSSPYTNKQVYDPIVIFNATDSLSFMVDYNYGSQKDSTTDKTLKYSGVAAYARWAITGKNTVALRYETTDDKDNIMFGGTNDTNLNGNKIQEITATYEQKISGDLLTRLEFRSDSSDDKIYEDKDGLFTKDHQNRVLIGAVYSF